MQRSIVHSKVQFVTHHYQRVSCSQYLLQMQVQVQPKCLNALTQRTIPNSHIMVQSFRVLESNVMLTLTKMKTMHAFTHRFSHIFQSTFVSAHSRSKSLGKIIGEQSTVKQFNPIGEVQQISTRSYYLQMNSSSDSPISKNLMLTVLASNASSSSTKVFECPHTKNDSLLTCNVVVCPYFPIDTCFSSLKIKNIFLRLVMGLSA
ncbi:hypothetical protein H5410_056990, partial [Solanum commersonii]